MKKLLYFLLIPLCFCSWQACSDDNSSDEPEPAPNGGDKKGEFALLLTEKVVQGYSAEETEAGSSYTGAYWASLDSVDVYFVVGGQNVEEKGHRLHLRDDGSLVSDTMTLKEGAYLLSKLVFFDYWGSKALEFEPTSDNSFVVEGNSFVEKSYKVKNQRIYSVARDSLALAALMRANFGNNPAGWPIDLTKAPSVWSYVNYDKTLQRITGLRLSTFQDTDRTADLDVVPGWGSTGLRIKVLPAELELMDALQDIDLAGNDIEEIPAYFKNMKTVYALQLDGNKLKEIPAEVFAMLRLSILTLDNNPIEHLPVLSSASNLATLNMVNCKLTSLGSELSNYKNITSLDVRNNQITSVGNLAGMLPNLLHLDLSNNQLTAITAEMLPAGLQALYATDNQIATLPSSWSGKELVTLNLSRNKLTAIPGGFMDMPLLSELFVSGNRLASLPVMSGLKELLLADFSDNQLESLPATIEECVALRCLYLMNNEQLDWTLPKKMKDRYCKCLTEEVDAAGKPTGELGMGPEGLFVKYSGSPLVQGVPSPPKCEYEYEGGDAGIY